MTYLFPSGAEWPNGYATGEADDVEEAVSLTFRSARPLSITWAMDAADEGIAIIETGQTAKGQYEVVEIAEVSHWRHLVGAKLVGFECVWHRADTTATETALALTLQFDNGCACAVALGEVAGEGFKYSPQALVVLHSQIAAASYVADVPTAKPLTILGNIRVFRP